MRFDGSLTIPDIVRGPARYEPRGPWRPLGGFVVTVGIILAQFAVALVPPFLAGASGASPSELQALLAQMTKLSAPLGVAILVGGQLASLALVWLAAGRGKARGETLRLLPPKPTFATALLAGAVLVGLTSATEIVLYTFSGLSLTTDASWLVEAMSGPLWWLLLLSVVILAPLWEEATFRGFLLSALTNSRLGFWPAALISNTAWAALHASYSWVGLVSVFVAGLGLSWLMWRTGSLWTCVVAHGVINATAFLFARVVAGW